MLSDDTADEKRNTDSEIEEEQDKLQREISDSVSEEMGRSESESKQEGGHAMEEKSEFRKDTTSKSNSKGEEDNRTSSTRAANVPFRKLEEVRYDEDRSDTRLEDAQDIRLSESHHMPMMHHDEQLSIFTEAPTVSVPNAVVEDAWPRKNVEYQVHLQYKAYKWTVNMSRKNLYGLWFYAKGKGLFKSGGDGRRTSRMSITRINSEGGDTPDLGKLFLVSAEKAVRPEKLQLVQRFLDSVLNVPELLSSSYVLSLLEVSASTFDEEGGYTSVMEGWLRFKIWTKRSDEEVTFSRGQCKCDNACYDCLCVIKKVSLKRNKWRWAALKSSCIAFYETILVRVYVAYWFLNQCFCRIKYRPRLSCLIVIPKWNVAFVEWVVPRVLLCPIVLLLLTCMGNQKTWCANGQILFESRWKNVHGREIISIIHFLYLGYLTM